MKQKSKIQMRLSKKSAFKRVIKMATTVRLCQGKKKERKERYYIRNITRLDK